MSKSRKRRTYPFTPEQRAAIAAEYRAAPDGRKRLVAQAHGVLPQTVVSWGARYAEAPKPNGNGHSNGHASHGQARLDRDRWIIDGLRHGWLDPAAAAELLRRD